MLDPKKNDNEDENSKPGDEAGQDVPPVNEPTSDVPALDTAVDVEEAEEKEESVPDLVPPAEEKLEPTDDESTPFDDEKTDHAIDEIVAKEGDDLLAAQDAAATIGGVKPVRKRSGGLLRSKWLRFMILLLVLAGAVAAVIVPKARYWILNTAGVRSSSSVIVVDSTTQLPLKGVSFSISGHRAKTDSEGKATLTGLKLGPAQLSVSQIGFEEINRNIVIGWGSNPFGNMLLKATGVQYVIEVHDYLSEKPVEGVEATDGQVTAISGKDGKITLSLGSAVIVTEGVTLSKAGYRNEKITLNQDPKNPTKAALVLARKAVFATKQSGKYDIYKSDIDGKNREVLLPGTGSENSNLSLVVSPDGNRAALVSTRDNKRDSDGFLLSSLLLINIESGAKVTIAESSQIQLIDWLGTRLVFQQASSDSTSGDRYKVVSYNYADNTRLQLVAANNVTAVMSAQGSVYYAVGADSANPSLQTGLFKIGADGSNKQRVFEDELSTALRSSYGSLSLQATDDTWYAYDISKATKTKTSTPGSLANRLYIDNADHSKSVWVSQGTLMSYDIVSAKDANVKVQTGLTYPLQWLSTTAVIYRVSSGSETADYAVSILGGEARKVSDVAASYGFAQAQ